MVFGADSFWLAKNGLAVGITKGVATLNLGDGGRVEVRGAANAMALGLEFGSEGRMDVNGGSQPVPSASDTGLTAETRVGVGGKGSLSVRSQGRILASKLTLGIRSGSESSLDVIGAGTSLEVGDTLEIGRAGNGRLTIFAVVHPKLGRRTRLGSVQTTDQFIEWRLRHTKGNGVNH